jgi:hypothetical protein
VRTMFLHCLAIAFFFNSAVSKSSPPRQQPGKPKRIGLVFTAIADDAFQIRYADVRKPPQFVKVGEQIPDTNYRVIAYTPELKRPTLTVEHTSSKAKVILQHRMVTWVVP